MPVLETHHLTHHFGGLAAVSDFNLAIEPHELVGVIGPNGAGKTTVFNLITGVYRATDGSISFADTEIVGKTPSEITSLGIARTFQNIRLFRELTVLDNVRVAHYAQVRYNAIEALLHLGRFQTEEKSILEHSLDLLASLKLESYTDELSKNLPYGLQRRLEIARALATRPQLLLLDEPAAGMNPQEVGQLMEFIQWIRQEFKLTILLIEHQMHLVMGICERLLVLDFGETIAEGKPREIQNNPRVLEVYLGETQ
ncbi:MAG: ABC transporter ATP-binding protein [Deltaproteobacteria bacterium]|nr:ABC transporter ATP-binding protein [Deltaproteobacteria bacterium]